MFWLVRYIVIGLIGCVLAYAFINEPSVSRVDIFKSIIATMLGGILSAFITLSINDFSLKQRSVLERKEKIYVPIYQDLTDALAALDKQTYWSKFNFPFSFPNIDRIMNSSYMFFSGSLHNHLETLKKLVGEYHGINHHVAASNAILNNFERALKEIYGEGEDDLFWEGFIEDKFFRHTPQPYQTLELLLSNHEEVAKIIDEPYNNDEFYNSLLKNFYVPPQVDLDTDVEGSFPSIGFYIAYNYPVDDAVSKNEKIVLKEQLYGQIISEIKNCLKELDTIFKRIHKKFEKFKY